MLIGSFSQLVIDNFSRLVYCLSLGMETRNFGSSRARRTVLPEFYCLERETVAQVPSHAISIILLFFSCNTMYTGYIFSAFLERGRPASRFAASFNQTLRPLHLCLVSGLLWKSNEWISMEPTRANETSRRVLCMRLSFDHLRKRVGSVVPATSFVCCVTARVLYGMH